MEINPFSTYGKMEFTFVKNYWFVTCHFLKT